MDERVSQQPGTHAPSSGEHPGGAGEISADGSVGYRCVPACHAAGITYRQLDYWARTGLVVPSVGPVTGSGSQRLYAFRDLVVLKVVKRLLDAGVSLQNIRKAVETLSCREVTELAEITLISDGTTVYECRSPEEVVELLQGGQGVFGIAMGGAFKEIQRALTHVPVERVVEVRPVAHLASLQFTDELAARRARRNAG